jgi:hypothetical protein
VTPVERGRFTVETDEPFVVFMIGMRINDFLKVREWLPAFAAMRPMIRSLEANPESGFLGAYTYLYWRGIGMTQYWRSFEDLERFARDPDDEHLPAWQRFNHNDRSPAVGIWHEAYLLEPGRYETIHRNMPPFGITAALDRVPVRSRLESARGRLRPGTAGS